MAPQRVQFGVFEFDPTSGDLRKGGLRIRVQEQPLKILGLLVARPGEVITREELRQALWPGDTFVDFERSLNTAVNKLREALGDRAQNPRFIETLPRRGYRFIAPVEHGMPAESTQLRPAPARPSRRNWTFVAVGSIAALAGVAVSIAVHTRAPARLPVSVTTYPGAEVQPSFSPDGSQVAFAWNGPHQDNFDIYVLAIGADRPLRLTSDPAPDLSPAWSPDGSRIAFTRSTANGAMVYVIPATGGAERAVTSLSVPVVYYLESELSWTSDGRHLVVSDREPGGGLRALYTIDTNDASRMQLTRPPPGTLGDFSPAVAPDGEEVVFSRWSGPSSAELYLQSLRAPSSEPRRLTVEHWAPGASAWMPNGRRLIYSGGLQHQRFLWSLSVPAGSPSLIAAAGQGASQPAIPRRGGRLLYTRLMWDANIWGVRLDAALRAMVPARPVVSSTAVDHYPALSPKDGKIAFVSNRSGVQEIWTCNADGGEPSQLTHLGGGGSLSPRWSPDGRMLVFSGALGNRQQIYTVSVSGGQVRRITDDTSDNITPSWSGDGRFMYFSSNRTGNFEVWKMAATGPHSARRLTMHGGWSPIESPDGKVVYYAKEDSETALWFLPTGGGAETVLLDSLSTSANFAVLDQGIIFIPRSDAALRSTVSFYSFETRSTEPIFRMEKRAVWGLTASIDRILFTQVDSDNSDLMLIDGFSP